MAFDGFVTKAIATELTSLIGARIDKVFQPDKNTILLGFYVAGKNYALTICIDSQNYRMHLTTHPKPNPQVAPNFCMVLRKNLIGLHLKNIITFDLERLIILEFEGLDEIDDILSKKLVVELMGKHSNVILLDESNQIIDSARHIKEDDQTFRDILPRVKYQFPSCSKKNFLDCIHFEDFIKTLPSCSLEDLPQTMANTFNGFSKLFVLASILRLELVDSSLESFKKLYDYLQNILQKMGTSSLSLVEWPKENHTSMDYTLTLKDSSTLFALNFFLDDFYNQKETSEKFKNYRNTLLKLILGELQKYQKRLKNMNQKLEECQGMEIYRIYGELITVNLYQIPDQKKKEIELENYYEQNRKIKIPLDPKYSPSVNAKRYFKKYHKLKNALEIVTLQKKETLEELNYLESIIYELNNCSTLEEVSSIFEEISENTLFQEKTSSLLKKITKVKKSKIAKNKQITYHPISYTIDGYTVLVGRNNRENDYLTFKLAHKNDLWFHTKDIHGSHVILKVPDGNSKISSDLLIKVASIAAFHSKAKNSSNVLVDYCEVKQVKKPSGSKPGMVIYHAYQTLNVSPYENETKKDF